MTLPIVLVALIVNYGTPSGQTIHIEEMMPSLEVCLKTAEELLRASGPEMQKYGIGVACFLKLPGEPS